MKNNVKNLFSGILALALVVSCEPQKDDLDGNLMVKPADGKITVNASDKYNPVFSVSSQNALAYHWDFGNGAKDAGTIDEKKTVTTKFTFAGTYDVTCTIYGAGGDKQVVKHEYVVDVTDPEIAQSPGFKELTNGGAGRTWVYNRGDDGNAQYTYQTPPNIVANPTPWEQSWGTSVDGLPGGVSPDVNGKMVFDLNGGINYTYYQSADAEGVKGTFVLDMKKKTLTVKDPYILDHNVEWTYDLITTPGVFHVGVLTDTEMILWQDMTPAGEGMGWAWSFKVKPGSE